ncbi:MAG: type II secretion system F family protein [Gemmatimonadaceae bacterium]|nr:type II secretion system F family protein [Gemmatimonadaceae bacterium]
MTTRAPEPRWRYRASDASGREARGDIAAENAEAAVAALQARALWVIDLEPVAGAPMRPTAGSKVAGSNLAGSEAAGATGGSGTRSFAHVVTTAWARLAGRDLEELAVTTRAAATLLAAGVPLDRALGHAVDSDAGASSSARWGPAFAALRDRVRRGESLAAAADAVPELPATFGPAFAAAEATGALPATFARLADHLERQQRTMQALRAALVYPTLLAVASVTGTLVILLVVVPRFAALLADSGMPLPWATRLLVASGALLARGGWLLLAALVLGGVAAWRFVQTPAGAARWHAWRLNLPVIGPLERARDAARYLDSLALALANGVPVLSAMRLARRGVRNQALAAALAPAEPAVRDGASLSQAIGACLPPLARRLLEAGEGAGALAAMAQRAAVAADGAVQRRIAQLVAIIEPFLILVFGGIVGFVALALLQAIYGLNAGQL